MRSVFILALILPLSINITPAQSVDSLIPPGNKHCLQKKKWHQSRLVRALAVPLLLIGYGVSTIQNHGIYSSYHAQKDIQKHFAGYHTHVDDYLKYSPYGELLLLSLLKVGCKSDWINTTLLIAKSELLMIAFVYPLKNITHIQRPNKADFHSFPSGHTSDAFVAASIVHKEYKHKSPWYGVGAYTLATSVAIFRMLNNAHWQSDVFAGAGFGMLAVHLVYLTHKYRWGKQLCLSPSYRYGSKGVALSYRF